MSTPTERFAALLAAAPVAADGAMGTALMALGLRAGEAPDGWNVREDRAALVRGVHEGHRAAGARILLTNTFGASPIRLRIGGADDPEAASRSICTAGAALARAASDGVLVAGSIGPTGALLEPWGDLPADEARAGFAVQALGLAEGGVDVAWIESMTDLAEALAAVDGVREAAPDLPIVVTLALDGDRTMMGVTPEEAVEALVGRGVAAVGANCGGGFEPVEAAIARMRRAAPALPLVAKANAGRPVLGSDGVTTYPASPEAAAEHARRVVEAGASVVGGCCGTTAEHVAAIAAALGSR
jgi:5-methyltetrahydrofolate--homocysteine methyltransferase